MDASITAAALQQALRSSNPPLVIDVRKRPAFLAAPDMIRGALRRDPESPGALPCADDVVVYCVHGHEMLEHGMVMYDALYAWCRSTKSEVHTWNPALIR